MGLANLVVIGYFATWLARHSDNVSLAPRWFTLAPAVLKPVLGVSVSLTRPEPDPGPSPGR